MSPVLLCADPRHPLSQAIGRRFGLRPLPSGTPLPEGDHPLLLLQTVSAPALRCDPGERPLLVIAPWHLSLPAPHPQAALLRHGPLVSDLGHHDQAITLQRLLLWPYGPQPMAWLADQDLLDAIEDWFTAPWQGERWLEGPEALTAEATAAAISAALQAVLRSPAAFAALKFQVCDRDGDQLIDPDELRATLLHAGVSASEASWVLELLGRRDGVDARNFQDGLGPVLAAALAEQQASLQLVRLEAPAAAAELLLMGWTDAAASDYPQGQRPVAPPTGIMASRGSTPLATWLNARVLDWIPVELLPGLGVLSRRAGRIEGQNALLFTYRRRDGRVALMERSDDFRHVDLSSVPWRGVRAEEQPRRSRG